MNEITTQTATATQTASAPRPLTPAEMAFNIGIFGLSLIPAVAITYYLFADPSRLGDAWEWIRSLPLIVQLGMWGLLLPWMLALWAFSMPWPFVIRFVLVLGIVLFGEYLLFPWKP